MFTSYAHKLNIHNHYTKFIHKRILINSYIYSYSYTNYTILIHIYSHSYMHANNIILLFSNVFTHSNIHTHILIIINKAELNSNKTNVATVHVVTLILSALTGKTWLRIQKINLSVLTHEEVKICLYRQELSTLNNFKLNIVNILMIILVIYFWLPCKLQLWWHLI